MAILPGKDAAFRLEINEQNWVIVYFQKENIETKLGADLFETIAKKLLALAETDQMPQDRNLKHLISLSEDHYSVYLNPNSPKSTLEIWDKHGEFFGNILVDSDCFNRWKTVLESPDC